MAEKKKIEGIVEAINSKNRSGIKIGGSWYNSNKTTKNFVSKIEKGDKVEIDIDEDGYITFVKNLGKTDGTTANDQQNTDFVRAIELTSEEREVLLKETVDRYNELMKMCKLATDATFGNDERYKDSLGQHCNSLFIAVDRTLREKGIRL